MKDYLKQFQFPEDLKEMDYDELELLSYEIRDFLIEKVSKTGGHLSSNLGAVELTIALHRCFDTPKDKIIWDVGHQTYVHNCLLYTSISGSQFPSCAPARTAATISAAVLVRWM